MLRKIETGNWLEVEDNRWVRASEIVAVEIREDIEDANIPYAVMGIYRQGIPITIESGMQTLETECLIDYAETYAEATGIVIAFFKLQT